MLKSDETVFKNTQGAKTAGIVFGGGLGHHPGDSRGFRTNSADGAGI